MRTKLRDWAVWQARAGCYSQAALSSNDSKTLYSKPSCLLECRARRMFEECDCLPYYYPNFQKVWDEDTTCTKEGLACLANITRE